MKKILLVLILGITSIFGFSQNNLPYPVIFVHGLTGSDQTFSKTFKYMSSRFGLGRVNVYDVVLNADNENSTADMSKDVKWKDFYFGTWYSRRFINVGRRSYADDMDDYKDGWAYGTNLFAINFKEERIRGAASIYNDWFDYSDQAAIYKQGYALSQMIKEVLAYTGAEKVILVGHSMGGLAIREYLQRTKNGVHVNWVDPNSSDGHKVAAVITYGTPNLGSNAGFDPTKSLIPDKNTEAMRDLKYSYDSYTYCSGTPVGIYLFGGYEYCILSTSTNKTFFNADINCDGDYYDYIVGIDAGTKDNPNMPLPTNIPYTWITSIWADWGGNLVGDGAVNIDRQWLHSGNTPAPVGIADTMLTHLVHTSEAGDYKTIIRAMDEPENPAFAYKLNYNKTYLGFITYQPNMYTSDYDIYKVNTSGLSQVKISITDYYSGVDKIEVFSPTYQYLGSAYVGSSANLTVNTNGNSFVYIRVHGYATSYSWAYPYKLYLTPVYASKSATAESEDLITNLYSRDGSVNITLSRTADVNIYDLTGKTVFSGKIDGSRTINLEKGSIYIIKATSKDKNETKKIIVQ